MESHLSYLRTPVTIRCLSGAKGAEVLSQQYMHTPATGHRMVLESHPARARASCSRCYKRKKKCDRTLPLCRNCNSARVRCSFEDDQGETASYPIDYVRRLEERLRMLEHASATETQPDPPTSAAIEHSGINDFQLGPDISLAQQSVAHDPDVS